MSGGVADDGALDYARIQMIPSENRYEAFVCYGNEVDGLAEGNLDTLLLHLPELQELNSKGSKASIKLQPSASSGGTTWFTKSTLRRFLQIVGSPELPNIMKTMNEMSQLEETKRFHLSLYGQGQMSKTEEKDGCNLDSSSPKHGSGPEFASSAASKNDLLRAMDLRLTALNKDLTAAFEKAHGAACSSKEISHLAKFTEHFGAINLKNCTYKYLELNPKSDNVELVNDDNKYTITSNICNENAISGSIKAEKSNSSTPVKYGVSPAKVAQIERQDSSETESSDSDNENGTPAERSRTMVRSTVARRSASPMRRVQIGRTGSRRAPAIMIRSLNHLQTRDGMFSQGDAAANSDGDEEGSEPSGKTADNNVGRISVQDAISLFESKQKNDASDIQKRRSLANITIGANKFVLRRWSTGMGEASTKCHPELVSDESDPISHDLAEEVPKSKLTDEEEVGSDNISSIDKTCTTAEVEEKLEDSAVKTSDPLETQSDSPISEPQVAVQKLSANSEWTRRKEAELDQMLKKVMESKHMAQNNSQANRKKDVNSEQRGELYDQYKAKRDEKRRAEEAKRNSNKEAKIKGTRQVADDRKTKIASAEVNVTKKRAPRKPEVPSANLSKSEKPKKEISKPSTIEKISSRTKPMAATRKSWPSSASERTTGISPATANATRQKAQPVSSSNRLSAKVEKSPMQKKNVKENNDSSRDLRSVKEKKEIVQAKTGKVTKTKVTLTGDSSVPVKSRIRDKVAKKSSIVPLESKSFHKGSRNSLDNSSQVVSKTKPSKLSKSADSSNNSKKLTRDLEVEVTVPDLASQPDKGDDLVPAHCDFKTVVNDQQDSEILAVDVVDADQGDVPLQQNEEKSSVEITVEGESMIPSKSTEEIEEFQELPANNDDMPQLASLENTAPIENPRVRLSLSQMLQEENSEPDSIDWGIAENPPMMNYQRGAPKGFKRLLKFARKSKGEANLAGWSSPSVVSEGEDDSEESKPLNTKKADNLLMKATHNSGLVKASLDKNFDHEKLYSGLISLSMLHSIYFGHNFISKLPSLIMILIQ
uniref:COP1-interacting protein 7 n=1 Tax=Cucumis sativus TaxID=3659 RepID=A0A0A0KPC7_CUCSA